MEERVIVFVNEINENDRLEDLEFDLSDHGFTPEKLLEMSAIFCK